MQNCGINDLDVVLLYNKYARAYDIQVHVKYKNCKVVVL